MNMKFFKHSLVSLFLLLTSISCDENDFLKEKPLDFYSPENSMETAAHFQTSVNYLYNRVRFTLWNMNADSRFALLYATDFAFCANSYYVPGKLNDYTNVMVPTFAVPLDVWNNCYIIITNANVILNRLELSQSVTESDKKTIRGEALFFRAFAYRFLANLYGGVPLVLQEVSEPRRDYVRATRDEVYLQVKKDLEEAETLLADIDKVKDGKISKQVVEHLLSEVYICLNLFDEAIQTAGKVIDYPAMGLMNARFGSRLDEEGDVYSDLFRLDNQNRSSGNKESLWVLQHDYLNPGSSNHNMPWALLPTYWNIQISEDDGSGKIVKTTAFMGMTDWKGGHSQAWMQPTNYFFNELWDRGSENDMRNSKYNIIRDLQIDNPQSPAFGKWFVKDGYYKQADSIRQWFPLITKIARIGNLPEEYYDKDANGEPKMTPFGEHLVTTAASLTIKDEYMFRLAETYLLRAEAYLGKGDQINAAADINIVRARANAEPVQSSEVDIDYILDERLRELYAEELRMLTLCRMGKLVDRNRLYNPATGKTILDYHNLWPIPFSEIERNIFSEISQNPGY
jgi:hypothetical protein